MAQLYCPLCKQEVSKVLYEKITGVWQEKEKVLAVLKNKEKQLLNREKQLHVRFESEKKKIVGREQAILKRELSKQQQSFRAAIKKGKDAIKKEKRAVEKKFEKRLASETNRILKEGKRHQKQLELSLKQKFKLSAEQTLSRERKQISKDKANLERKERIQLDKNRKLNQQFISFQSKSKKTLGQQDKKIALLKEQLQKNQTPQVLGLLEEGIFLQKLKQMFEGDIFKHTGKGGDILHHVVEKGQEVGTIVYELKKVSNFSKSHIDQTLQAKQKRNADYGILVTNAKRAKDDFGFNVAKGIIIIHPAGSLVLIGILRDHIVRISKLQLSAEKRKKTVQAVLEYIQSPTFRNGVEGIIEDTKDLHGSLTKEVDDHLKIWDMRLKKYIDIYSSAYKIDTNAIKLLAGDRKLRITSVLDVITPIALPPKID